MHDWVLVTPRHPHHLKAYERTLFQLWILQNGTTLTFPKKNYHEARRVCRPMCGLANLMRESSYILTLEPYGGIYYQARAMVSPGPRRLKIN
ncbi:hypothetical protein AFLA_002406 [Aspergillus flavus NRRL3357]|nr:hypothetical protein AFLA_002406 [Aspergillus flavus NRRL3357]